MTLFIPFFILSLRRKMTPADNASAAMPAERRLWQAAFEGNPAAYD